jgi:hypothetical protein
MNNTQKILKQTFSWFKELIPMLMWILLLISILKELWLFNYLSSYLSNNFLSIIIADIFGSISAWNTINSYIIADTFWDINENILIISVFLISWVTVWFIQIPAEIYFFGKKFTFIRNLISFIFAIIWAYIIYLLMNI